MARQRAPVYSSPPPIARRSCSWRRTAAVEDVLVDLGQRTSRGKVREKRNEEIERMGQERGLGVAEVHRRRASSPAEMADGGVVLGQPGGARELRSGAKRGGEARA